MEKKVEFRSKNTNETSRQFTKRYENIDSHTNTQKAWVGWTTDGGRKRSSILTQRVIRAYEQAERGWVQSSMPRSNFKLIFFVAKKDKNKKLELIMCNFKESQSKGRQVSNISSTRRTMAP